MYRWSKWDVGLCIFLSCCSIQRFIHRCVQINRLENIDWLMLLYLIFLLHEYRCDCRLIIVPFWTWVELILVQYFCFLECVYKKILGRLSRLVIFTRSNRIKKLNTWNFDALTILTVLEIWTLSRCVITWGTRSVRWWKLTSKTHFPCRWTKWFPLKHRLFCKDNRTFGCLWCAYTLFLSMARLYPSRIFKGSCRFWDCLWL